MLFFPSRKTAKRILITGFALPLFLLVTAAHAQDQGKDPGQWDSGKNLYDKVCGHCHKPEVGVGTSLNGRELPLEYLRIIVRNGFNAMPAFPASFIDDESLAQVARYLASLPAPTQP